MIKELLHMRFGCPVCGRILYKRKIRGYWCPYCGTDLVINGEESAQIEVNLQDRLTNRDENGVPYYCGKHTMRTYTYPGDLNQTAITEILEKLCQYEELDEDNQETNSNEENIE